MASALLAWLAVTAAVAADSATVLDQIRTSALDPERAVALQAVEIELGLGRLWVERAVLIPARPVGGRTMELLLVGRAQFRITPPDEIEASQLELFTGRHALDAPVEEAVLVIADQRVVERLLQRPPSDELHATLVARAAELFDDWVASTERRRTGVESGMFRAVVDDAAFRHYAALWCRSHEVGEFFYQLDPEDMEQLTLASFVPLDVRGWERKRLARHMRVQQRKGRFLGMRIDDLGAWDIWLSAPWSEGGEAAPGSAGFESRHYELDVTVRRQGMRLEGRARLELETMADDRRAVSLELFRDLRVRRVVDDAGRELFFFQSGSELVVELPEPSRAGRRFTLEIDYAGRALQRVGRGVYDLADTDDWYPHCGSVDRATYDVTVRWPRRYEMFAGGQHVASGTRGPYRWERRKIERPAIAFSFVLGQFRVLERSAGDVRVKMAFNRRTAPGPRERVADTVVRAVEFLQSTFGAYPLGELTVVTLPRDYSQSYLGFVTLSDSIVQNESLRPFDAGEWIRETTIAHEVAHQWWGNLVGWWSYRDQWLSEAMANYAGLLFYRQGREDDGDSLTDLSVGWRDSLEQALHSGRTVESLGPIVLGNRLNSSEASNGYRAIVYRKGAVVLAMLARAVGEERFLEMMRTLLDAAEDRVLTTESFIDATERMSGLDLDGFTRQYVYGTGIPLVYYDYRVDADGSTGWIVRGEARRHLTPKVTQRIERRDGRWDVVREPRHDGGADSTALMLPFHFALEPRAELASDANSAAAQRAVRSGQLLLRGSRERFEFESQRRPHDFRLDPRGETLAHFVSAHGDPKRYLRLLAESHVQAGRDADAESLFRRALAAPSSNEPAPRGRRRDPQAEALRENARIHLRLARFYLDLDREAEAEGELDALVRDTDDQAKHFLVESDTLWARLEVRRGDYDAAFKRLKRMLRQVAPRRKTAGRWWERSWRPRSLSERLALTEAHLLLAVAAHETRHTAERAWAVGLARDAGADLSVLEAAARNP